jgi:hypothetical protein
MITFYRPVDKAESFSRRRNTVGKRKTDSGRTVNRHFRFGDLGPGWFRIAIGIREKSKKESRAFGVLAFFIFYVIVFLSGCFSLFY